MFASQASLGAVYSSTGSKQDASDGRAQAQAVVNYLNAHGGLGGHHIIPVYDAYNTTSTDTFDQQQAYACSLFTQDHHVVAAFSFISSFSFRALGVCLASHHALYDQDSIYVTQSSDYAGNPYFIVPDQLTAERMVPAWLGSLSQQGFFGNNPSIGIISWDDPAGKRAAGLAKATLSARHLTVRDSVQVSALNGFSDAGNAVSQIQGAALRFHAEGINHVLSLLTGENISFFMEQAQNQQWFPEYGMSTFDQPYLTQLAGIGPEAQMKNAWGAGWQPLEDVDFTHGTVGNPTASLCSRIQGNTAPSQSSKGQATTFCDFLLMLQAAAAHVAAGQPLSGDALVAGVNQLGRGYRSAMSFGTALSATRHDGVTSMAPFRFESGCKCFSYSGTPAAAS
jgi:hypothetical protein